MTAGGPGWLRLARAHLRGLGGEPAIALLTTTVVLILAHHQGSGQFFRAVAGARFASHPAAGALPYLYWFGVSGVFYLAVPLAVAWLTRGGFHRRYGLGLGDVRAGLTLTGLFLAVMVPAVLLAARWPTFRGHYPLAHQAAWLWTGPDGRQAPSLALFALYELAYLAYFVGWEFLFRGYLTHALLPRFGRLGAIVIPTVPFALMHLGKPELETLGSVVAGLALGVLALRTRSFWYGAVLHGAVAVLMDVLAARPYLAAP